MIIHFHKITYFPLAYTVRSAYKAEGIGMYSLLVVSVGHMFRFHLYAVISKLGPINSIIVE